MRLYKIKKSKIDKNGLYANCDIQKGTKIIEYKGKIISVKKSAQDPKFDNGKAIYLFNINRRFDLDGDFKFNTARLINHSCSPNCEVLGEGLKIWIYAIKIMVLVLMKILKTILANVGQKIALNL